MKPTTLYPKHQNFKLNDGNLFSSPAFGCGTALFGQSAMESVGLALQNGWRHIDNAREYGNEDTVDAALTKAAIPRDQLYLTSKYDAIDGASVEQEFNQTLSDLGVDYLDLYLVHWPHCAVAGGGIHKVWRAFESLKRSGKVRSIGVSNYGVEDLEDLLTFAEILPAVNQICHHVYNAQDNSLVIALAQNHGIITAAWGSLTPITVRPGGQPEVVANSIAKDLPKSTGEEVTAAQAVLDWVRTTGIAAVTTSNKEYRLKEQLAVFAESFPLLTEHQVKEFEDAGLEVSVDS